ncbi:hypothetical protein K9N50_06045 [bacterium]|nr:hypothetical protein [bacterium]
MRQLLIIIIILLLCTVVAKADMTVGDTLPNPTIKDADEKEIKLHDLLDKVSVIHLWKCQ